MKTTGEQDKLWEIPLVERRIYTYTKTPAIGGEIFYDENENEVGKASSPLTEDCNTLIWTDGGCVGGNVQRPLRCFDLWYGPPSLDPAPV